MAHFIISYDLHNQRTYEPVWKVLEDWGAVRVLESLWLVTIDKTSAQVRDTIKTAADDDDSIVVIELKSNSDWASWRGRAAGVAWLKKNL